MYRELLWRYIENHNWAKLQEPCGEETIKRAEKYIGHGFPAELKALLRETDGDGWLLLSAEEMLRHVKTNREIFPEAFDSEEEYLEKVDRHIFFATNGCGDYYCYRVKADGSVDESEIFIWEHELFETRPAAKDIADLICKYYTDQV